MRLLIATDAWYPQVNGVVRSLSAVIDEMRNQDQDVRVLSPNLFRTVPCPSYSEIRLAIWPYRRICRVLEEIKPETIHIATEGPIGLATRRYCLARGLAFTTSLHTRFPEYISARTGLPVSWGYRFLRWFHGPATRIMVSTQTLIRELNQAGLDNLGLWGRGVDLELFKPGDKSFLNLPRPIAMYVGRVAVEKNIKAFLNLDLPGTKVVVGSGPMLEHLRKRHPDVVFTGNKSGKMLAAHYRAADVFVFPSLTDTFGNVILEALACGVPVAAFPVAGPLDVMETAPVGCMDHDLRKAIRTALFADPAACRTYAERFSWAESTRQFVDNLVPAAGPQETRNCQEGPKPRK